MKRAISAIMAVLMLAATAMAETGGRGEKTMGVRAGYMTYNESATAGLYFKYRFSRHFAISPNINYAFRHHGWDGLTFSINAQFPIAVGVGKVELYPLCGLSAASWSKHYTDPETLKSETTRTTRYGFNVGAGATLRVTSTLHLNVEGTLNAIRNHNQGIFTVGIGYCF